MTDGMQTVLATTLAELGRIEAEMSRLGEQADALRQVAEGIRAFMGAKKGVPTDLVLSIGPEPRGKDAVRRIMAERPHAIWTVSQIKDEALKRGWISDSNRVLEAMRTNVLRALDAWPEEIIRVGRGQFAFVPPQNADSPDSSGLSDRIA